MKQVTSAVLLVFGAFGVFGCAPERTAALRTKLEEVPQILGLRADELKLEEESLAVDSWFGSSLAAASNSVLIGAPAYPSNGEGPGAVVPFTRTEDGWKKEAVLLPEELVDGSHFGESVAAHGNLAAIGAPMPPEGSGAVWQFENVAGVWQPMPGTPLSPPTSVVEPAFGRRVALSSDVLVIVSDAAVYVSDRDGSGWAALVPLPIDPELPTLPGAIESVAAFGKRIALGLPYGKPGGLVYTFDREHPETWKVLKGADAEVEESAGGFGYGVALDESRLLVGAPGDDTLGSAFVFEGTAGGGWQQTAKLVSRAASTPDGLDGDQFGTAVGLAFGRAFVGVPSYDTPRVQAFSLDGENDELARFRADDSVGSFGRVLATGEAIVAASGYYRGYAFTLELGAPCDTDGVCGSGHCVEGVCCSTACEETCSSCLAANKAAGTDGVCGPVLVGTDPRDSCEVGGECQTTGECDGQGQCAIVVAGTLCDQATCTDGAMRGVGSCDGEGLCVLPEAEACAPGYVCADAACLESCETPEPGAGSESSGCDEAHWCFDGACVTGARCSEDRRTAYDEEGRAETCTAVLCRDNVCPTQCVSSRDCDGLYCHPSLHQCVEKSALTPEEEPAEGTASRKSEGCSLVGRGSHSDGLLAAFVSLQWVLLGSLRRARRRRDALT